MESTDITLMSVGILAVSYWLSSFESCIVKFGDTFSQSRSGQGGIKRVRARKEGTEWKYCHLDHREAVKLFDSIILPSYF